MSENYSTVSLEYIVGGLVIKTTFNFPNFRVDDIEDDSQLRRGHPGMFVMLYFEAVAGARFEKYHAACYLMVLRHPWLCLLKSLF